MSNTNKQNLQGFLWGGEHTKENSYLKNTQVKVTKRGFVQVYVARRDVPRKVEIGNPVYWDIQYISLLSSDSDGNDIIASVKEEIVLQLMETGFGIPEVFPVPGSQLVQGRENSWTILVAGDYLKVDGTPIYIGDNSLAVALSDGEDWNVIRSITLDLSTYLKDYVNNTSFNALVQAVDNKVEKESGKSLISVQLIDKLESSYTAEAIDSIIAAIGNRVNELDQQKVDKETGKGLSSNDFKDEHLNKVDLIQTDGEEDKYLSENGEYRKVVAPIQSISVNNVPTTIVGGNVDITTPKAPIQKLLLNGESLPPDPTGTVAINVVTEAEQTLVPNSTLPVASSAVYSALQDLTRDSIVRLVLNESGESDNRVISISGLNAEDEVISTTDEFAAGGGGGGGGDVATTQIILSKITTNPTVKEGDEVLLEYYYDHRDKQTQESTGLSATAEITITAGASSRTFDQVLTPDNYYRLFLTDLMLVGTNNVRVKITVDNGETIQVSSIQWRVQVITLRLTSSFNYASVVNAGANIVVPFSLTGSGNKNLKLYVDGELVDERLLISSLSNGNFIISTGGMSHGNHSVQLIAELSVSETVKLSSNSIYFDVAVRGNLSTPIITTRFDYQDGTIIPRGQRPYVNTSQFAQFPIYYAGYNPLLGQNNIVVKINGLTISSITSPFEQKVTYFKLSEQGEAVGEVVLGSAVYRFGVRVAASLIDLDEPVDNIVFKLSALGRNNSDTNVRTWSDRGITSTFYGVQFSGDGWLNNALRLSNDSKVEINYKALSVANASSLPNSFTFQTKFKVSTATNKDTALISCMNAFGAGFKITSEAALFLTGGNKEVLMNFAPEIEYNITFVSMPTATPNSSEYERLNSDMLLLYIDGALSKAIKRGESDNIYHSENNATNIILQGKDAILDVYTVRCYKGYLTSDQVLDIAMLDKTDINETIAMYNHNNIIDSEGDVTIDSLPDGTRIMVITGEMGGQPVVKYASFINDKDVRYPVTEILHVVKGQDQSLNFRQVGGCLRLQGTSSLAYPIKNFRTYFRSATSGSVFAQVFKGVDIQGVGGELITDAVPKFSFKKANSKGKLPAPVNVWCQKADFAESSSSHNTGYAKLVNDALVEAGFLTPAQKYQSSHPYDIRTTIDGDPLYLFYRSTLDQKPKFAGKYNMNNDKSTEEVFGFKDTPYHKLPNAFTECYEFLNNDYPMGMYLDDDFDSLDVDGKPKWTKVLESRFPDVQSEYESGARSKPLHLERIFKWVKSTQGNPAKFKAELAEYFDVDYLCAYFTLTQMFMNVDQMVKNAMLSIYHDPATGRNLGYYIFYDNDTMLGVRNDGRLKYGWDIDRQSIDPELGSYAYMGHNSVLWNNLELMFQPEISSAYRRLRAVLTNERILNMFNVEQQGKFPERIFNIDSILKYIEPANKGDDFIDSLQGPRTSHRTWIISNRLDLYDARYNTGQYTLTDITWKGNSSPGASLSAKVGRLYFLDFRRESSIVKRQSVNVGEEFTVTYPDAANIGTIFHLYGGKFITELDMSRWGGFTDLNFPTLPFLERLTLGRSGITNTLATLVVGSKFPLLKHLDVTNFVGLSTLDLGGCFKLSTVVATGCTSLGTINLPMGSPVTSLRLPSNLTTLSLKGLPNLSNSGIIFSEGNNVRNLIVESSPNINFDELFTTLGGVTNIRLTGINVRNNTGWLDRFRNLGGIDANGNLVSTPRLSGKFYSETYLSAEIYNAYRTTFPELEIVQPSYSKYMIYQQVANPSAFFNFDNGTGYDPSLVIQNNPYVCSGHLLTLLNKFHRYLGKHTSQTEQTIIRLDDKNSNRYYDGTQANLTGAEGDVWVKIPKYYYKGINDHLNNKFYICYSSDEKKPEVNQDALVVPGTAFITAQSDRFIDTSVTTSVENAIKNSPTPGAVTIKKFEIPKGYTRLRHHTFVLTTRTEFIGVYPNVGSLFLDEDNNIIGKVTVNDTVCATGDYIISDIPAGAKYFYLTMWGDQPEEFDFLVFGKADTPIEDFEPYWVEAGDVLVSAFGPIMDTANNKLMSVSRLASSSVPNEEYAGIAASPSIKDKYQDALNTRAWEVISAETIKNIGWLILLYFGTHRISSTLGGALAWNRPGSGNTFHNIRVGHSTDFGIETTNQGRFKFLNELNEVYYSRVLEGCSNFFGLENIYTAQSQNYNYSLLQVTVKPILGNNNIGFLRRVNVWNEALEGQVESGVPIFGIQQLVQNALQPYLSLTNSPTVLSKICGGKYALFYPGSSIQNGSTNTYLCTTSSGTVIPGSSTILSGGSRSQHLGSRLGESALGLAVGDSHHYMRCRPQWKKQFTIKEITNVSSYKTLSKLT